MRTSPVMIYILELMKLYKTCIHSLIAVSYTHLDVYKRQKEMLQNAKLAIVMRNGDTSLFPYADFICDASYQDSIQKTLQQFQFI